MTYDFFFSYTRANNDDYLKRFFDDLSREVRDKRGLPLDAPVGFFDQRDLELGEDWDQAIVAALQSSKVVVAVASPAYFKSEYCGKEWELFRLRCAAAVNPGQVMPPLIKPIVWIPFKDAEVPQAVSPGQRVFGDPQALHNTKGFKYLLKQLQEQQTRYNDLVLQLAQEIVDAGDAHAIPPLPGPDVPQLSQTASAFLAPPGPNAVPPSGAAAASGPKHVRFVYVAADPGKFGAARMREPYLDAGGPDWKPFYPDNKTRVHRFVQNLVSDDELD